MTDLIAASHRLRCLQVVALLEHVRQIDEQMAALAIAKTRAEARLADARLTAASSSASLDDTMALQHVDPAVHGELRRIGHSMLGGRNPHEWQLQAAALVVARRDLWKCTFAARFGLGMCPL